jgi:CPA2 family monovalent cation:H+ antiporter-2
MLVAYWLPILVISVTVVVGKVVTCAFGAFIGGNDTRTSLRVGMGLAQIGEFSFIIASLGLTLNVTSKFLYPIAVAVSAVTTLLTPYLIRSADKLVEWFDRRAPQPVVRSLALYTEWVGQLGNQRRLNLAAELTRRWLAQMALNVALVTAVFVGAIYVAEHPPAWLQSLALRTETVESLLWLAAVMSSMPLLVATSRKLQALGLLIAETKVPAALAGERTAAIRAIVAQGMPIAGTAALGLYVLVLSSAILPTFKILLVLLLLAGVSAWLLRRSFIRVYAKAQLALQETFAAPPGAHTEHIPRLPSILRDAHLNTVLVAAHSPAAGKLIRELALRSQTGASIVGFERQGTNVINPGPDEELHAGDQLLLLGNRQQLEAATRLLTQTEPVASEH